MRKTGKHCVIEGLESRRLLSVVAIDMNFGVQGRVVSDFSVNTSSSWDSVGDATLQSDGKLLVLGSWDSQGRPDSLERPTKPYLVRYNADGTRDQSFAPGGQLALPIREAITYYNHMQLLPDGKMLLLGSSLTPPVLGSSSDTRMLFVRLNPDLSLDASFGDGGVATSDYLRELHRFSFAVLPDGKILVGGRFSASGSDAALWRFNSDATLDATFGSGGVVRYATGGAFDGMIDSLLLSPDGSFFGTTVLGEAKFNPDGSIDTTFGSQGYLPYPPLSTGIVLKCLLPDGKLLGLERVIVDNGSDVRVSLWNPDGTPDSSFGNNGSVQIDLGQWDFAFSMNVDSAGRILVGAGTQKLCCDPPQRPGLARLLPDGQLDLSFGIGGKFLDLFGNGHGPVFVFPTADNKIITLANTSDPSTEKPLTFNQDQNISIVRYVPDVPINISIQPTGSVNEGSTFLADAGGSSYDNGQIVRSEWDNSYDEQSFTADNQGVFTVLVAGDNPNTPIALRVTTSDGLRALASFNIPTINVPPVANAGPDRLVLAGTSVQQPLQMDDAVRETGSLRVDYGDGTPQSVINFISANSFTATTTHTYTKSGTLMLTLTADDGDGGIGTDTATIQVVNIIANVFQDLDGGGTKSINEPVFPNRTVWIDLNDNGVQDPTEPATVTDANGDAFFSGLSAGTYKLRMQVPADWQLSFQNSSFRGDYNTATITATAGVKVTFGLTQKAMITGTVFNDQNGNGVRDTGEPAISGQGIDIIQPSTGAGFFGGFSPADGFYRIRGLSPAEYRISVAAPSGWVQTLPAGKGWYIVSPGAAQTIANIDFGLRQVAGATAKGSVFEDVDGDGANGAADRPYYPSNANAKPAVYLDADNDGVLDPNERTISLASDSTWTVSQLAAGTYAFRLVPRPGWMQTFPADNAAQTATFTAGATVMNLNFGLHKTDLDPPQVSSFAFRHDRSPNSIEFVFSEPVQISSSALQVQLVGGNSIAFDLTSYDSNGNKAVFSPHSTPILADANYRAILLSDGFADLAGNKSGPQQEWPYFVLKGDLNRDRTVSVADFIALAANFNKSPATYADGDINYDGQVSIADFIELAANFNKSLPTTAAQSPQAAASSVTLTRQKRPGIHRHHHPRRDHHVRPFLFRIRD